MSRLSHPLDPFLVAADSALRTLFARPHGSRAMPTPKLPPTPLSEDERRESGALMRINHVGEVCAQALYNAQGRFAKTAEMREQFEQAGREEEDHLAWTSQRLGELNSHISVLNPLFYAGAYALGAVAAVLGDARSLGFVVETERQVEAHLASHLDKLPQQDAKSRAVVDQMRIDEIAHGAAAQALGAAQTPAPVQAVMSVMGKIMTSTAYYI